MTDVLAAAGHLDSVVEDLLRHAADGEPDDLGAIADLVAAAYGPILEASDVLVLAEEVRSLLLAVGRSAVSS